MPDTPDDSIAPGLGLTLETGLPRLRRVNPTRDSEHSAERSGNAPDQDPPKDPDGRGNNPEPPKHTADSTGSDPGKSGERSGNDPDRDPPNDPDGRGNNPGGLPCVMDLRRFVMYVYSEKSDHPGGAPVAVGVEFPEGAVLADLDTPAAPVEFENIVDLRHAARDVVPGEADLWLEYIDSSNGEEVAGE